VPDAETACHINAFDIYHNCSYNESLVRTQKAAPHRSAVGCQREERRWITFHTDATIYRCSLEAEKEVTHKATSGRRIFIYLTEGQVSANSETLKAKDQARIDIEESLVLKAQQQSELILIDVPSCKGWGYSKETLKGKRK